MILHIHENTSENAENKKESKLVSFLKQNSDIIQAICALLSVTFIGVCGLLLTNKSNNISENQFYYSTQPYFIISEIGNGDLEEFQICNEGGYIQNASLELASILKIDIYGEEEFVQTIYIPFGESLNDIYNIKNESFTIHNPKYVMETSEMENRLYTYYTDTQYDIDVSQFQYITLVYLDCNRNYREEKYLICLNSETQEYSLAPLNEELNRIINNSIPELYKDEDIVFPNGAIWTVDSSSGRGATRTFTNDAEQIAKEIIEEINQIINKSDN